MTISKESARVNVGIDVGKSQLDIHILERDRHFAVDNSPAGIRDALKILGRFICQSLALRASYIRSRILKEQACSR